MGLFFLMMAVLLRIISNPLANVYQKKLTAKSIHPFFINFITYAFLSVACVFILLQYGLHNYSATFWLYSLLAGMAGAAGNGFLVKALEKGDLSVLGPVNAYKSIVAMLVGIFVIGEIPRLAGLLGVAIIILGSYLVMETMPEGFSWKLLKRKEIQFRIWAMVLTAIEAVLIKKIILSSSVSIAFVSWCFFGALFSGILLLAIRVNPCQQQRMADKDDFVNLLMILVCIGTMQLTTNYAFANMDVGYALSFFQLSIIVSVLLGYKFFGEEQIRKKLLGAAIMIIGAIFIIFSAGK